MRPVPRRESAAGARRCGCRTAERRSSTLIKALARASRCKRMLESGQFTTIGELAAHGGIAHSYMTRVLRLTLLAPDVVEGSLDGRQQSGSAPFLDPFPAEWKAQRDHFD